MKSGPILTAPTRRPRVRRAAIRPSVSVVLPCPVAGAATMSPRGPSATARSFLAPALQHAFRAPAQAENPRLLGFDCGALVVTELEIAREPGWQIAVGVCAREGFDHRRHLS